MKIKLTNIIVNEPVKAFEFYTRILGFEEHTYMPEHSLAIVVSEGSSPVMLEPKEHDMAKKFQESMYNDRITVLVLGTEDIYSECVNLKEKRVIITQEPTKTDWGTIAVFDDSCGNLIQIYQD